MTDAPVSLMPEHLRRLQAASFGRMAVRAGAITGRPDRLVERVSRIERRLDPIEA